MKLDEVAITRGTDRIDADGTYLLPEDFANLKTQPVDARLSIAIPDLTQFAADPRNLPFPLQGSLNAKGSVQIAPGELRRRFRSPGTRPQGQRSHRPDRRRDVSGLTNNVATVKAGKHGL